MRPFQYTTASSAEQAIKQAQEPGAIYIGGGTTLADLMKLNVLQPDSLIDVRKMSSGKIKETGSVILIPGTATNSEVAHDALVIREFPVLSEAVLSGASPQIRNMATVAGNIMQKTRCYYYRDTTMRCNKRVPGSGCDAIDGINRVNAVVGGSDHCIAVNPSDMSVAMAMLDAVVHISSGTGERTVPLIDFHTLPGEHPEIETVLKPGEVIVAIEIAKSGLARNSMYLKVRDRASFSFALASAAVALNVTAGVITSARLAMGGVGTKPWRVVEAERYLIGKPMNSDTYRSAADIAMRDAVPRKYNKFKIELAKRTIVRAYEELQAKV